MKKKSSVSEGSGGGWKARLAGQKRLAASEAAEKLRGFNQKDWCDFLIVLAAESDGVEAIYSAFSLDRDSSLTQSVAEVIATTDSETRALYGRGFDEVLAERCLQSKVPLGSEQSTLQLFLLARMAGFGPSVETLKAVMLRSGVKKDLRETAALTLADYSGPQDLSFWRGIVGSGDQVLFPVGLLFLSTAGRPIEVFRAIAKCEATVESQEAVRLSVDAALQRYSKTMESDFAELCEVFESLPSTARQIVDGVLRLQKFSDLRSRMNLVSGEQRGPVGSLPVSGVRAVIDMKRLPSLKTLPSLGRKRVGLDRWKQRQRELEAVKFRRKHGSLRSGKVVGKATKGLDAKEIEDGALKKTRVGKGVVGRGAAVSTSAKAYGFGGIPKASSASKVVKKSSGRVAAKKAAMPKAQKKTVKKSRLRKSSH
ncbi:MAG: hypothetical protein NT171_11375 [Planctomycetota bacterium]|nr:hypothetical protein [Planctomycetota bacterium]